MGKIRSIIRKRKILFFRKLLSKAGEFDFTKTLPVPSLLHRLTAPIKKYISNSHYLESAFFGPFLFEIMRTACNVGLIKLLDKRPGMKLEEIAEALNIEPYPTRVLLLGLAPMKLVHKIDDQYFNNPFLSQLLLEKANDNMSCKYMEYVHHIISPAIHYLQESVTQNKPVGLTKLFGEQADNFYYELSQNEEKNRYFEPFMRLYSQLNRDRVAAMDVFSRFNKILDVGGNTGDLAMAIARHHPSVCVTVFDFPSVVENTNKRFNESNLSNRLDTMGGNVLESSFPTGYDCIMFSHFFDIFAEETNKQFLHRAFQSITSGGYVGIFTPIVSDDETGPLRNCIYGAYFLSLANGEGRIYSAKDITSWLKDVGFVNIEKRLLPCLEAFFLGKKP